MFVKYYFFFLSLFLTVSCTYSVHLSQINRNNQPISKELTKQVEIVTERKIFLGFTFNSNYVDDAYDKLLKACPQEVVAVNTQYSTSHSFLHWTNKITLRAICLK